MGGDAGYFGDHDPEWAVTQLRAHAAAGGTHAPRRLPWLVAAGVLLTTGLVAGGFVLGLTRQSTTELTPSAPAVSTGPTTEWAATPSTSPRVVAPRVTLAAVPRARHTPAPPRHSEPSVVVVTVYTPVPAAPPPAKSHKPSNQVGPNRPIKTPIDPDD
jgi:hypothetical protein